MNTGWISVPEAARRIGLSRQAVRRLAHDGVIPAVKAGTGRTSPYRIREADAAAYRRARAS